jgi:hypothetical protein
VCARACSEGEQVVVRWKDGHVSPFSQDYLRRYAYDNQSRSERRGMRRAAVPWTPEVLISESVALEINYSDLMEKDEGSLSAAPLCARPWSLN